MSFEQLSKFKKQLNALAQQARKEKLSVTDIADELLLLHTDLLDDEKPPSPIKIFNARVELSEGISNAVQDAIKNGLSADEIRGQLGNVYRGFGGR